MSPNIGKSQRLYSLDDLYLMVTSIYGEQNADRSPTAAFAHSSKSGF